MRPPTIKPSTPSSSVDPLTFFPKELFNHLFQFSDSKEKLELAATSREWRQAILSTPSLFSMLAFHEWEHDGNAYRGLDEWEYQEKANKVIARVLRLANLGGNFLKGASFHIKSFVDDPSLGLRSWKATKLSLIFNILYLSSDSLKTLDLDLDTQHSNRSSNSASTIRHAINIIKQLEYFKALQTFHLTAELNFTLSSEGPSRVLNIIAAPDQSLYETNWEQNQDYGPSMSSLFEGIANFTSREIREFRCQNYTGESSDILRRLNQQQSNEALKELELYLLGAELDYQESFRLSSAYPDLIRLDFEQFDPTREEGELVFESGDHMSNLKSLRICVDGQIIWDSKFTNWVSGRRSLKELRIEQSFDEDSSHIIGRAFQQFLLNSSSSLVILELSGLSLTSGEAQEEFKLKFQNLRNLHLQGNSDLINTVLDAGFPSLQHLVICDQETQTSSIDHRRILKVLESCKSTIVQFSLVTQVESKVSDGTLKTDSSEVYSLPMLRRLNLMVGDTFIENFYSSIQCLNVFSVDLPKSSKLSKASFTSKRD